MSEAEAAPVARRAKRKAGCGGSLPHLVGGISRTIVQNTKGAITFLFYHNSFKSGNLTLSIDNIVMDLYISRPPDRERLMHLLDKLPVTHAIEVTHWNSFKMGSFKEQFSIRFQDGNSFWMGVVLNGRKPEWGRVRLEFNPNKTGGHGVFQMVLGQCVCSTRPMHRKIRRYDLAVDIPVLRQDAFLVKDSRAYIERRHGQEWTQYLGAKSSTVGRVKLYNKQTEAHLNYPLTRLEITLDPAKKSIIKGARLHMYPPGFNIYRTSRGIKRPAVSTMTESEAQKLVGDTPLTYEKTISLTDSAGEVKNIINYRTYTKSPAKDSGGTPTDEQVEPGNADVSEPRH